MSSNLENEVTSDYATFEHFDRTWRVPNKRHLSHLRFMRAELQAGVGTVDMLVAEAFLSPAVSPRNVQDPDQFAALVDLDPDESELHAFNSEISRALGAAGVEGDAVGNSSPSSASS